MKKLLYLIGLIGAISLAAGITFKLLRMSYGNELFSLGFLTLLLVFIPLVAISRYKTSPSKTTSMKWKLILGVVAAVTTGLSGLFKLMHLAGADLLLMIGTAVFALGFLPLFFFGMYKKSVS